MTKKAQNHIMFYVLLGMPIIDVLTSIATWNHYPSLGIFIKGFLLLYAVIYLIKTQKQYRSLLGILLSYSVMTLLYYYICHYPLMTELTNIIKIFYLPILSLFFLYYRDDKINKQLIMWISVFYLLLYLVPYPLGLGHNISEIYPNKDLYLSYFYIGNELVNNFIIFIPISLSYLIEKKKRFLIPYLLLVIAMLYLLGTKTMIASIFVIAFYLIYYYREKIIPKIKKQKMVWLIVVVLFLSVIGLILPRTSIYKNIKTSLQYYQVNELKDIKLETIDQVVFSNRLSYLSHINMVYVNSNISTKLFGLGRNTILTIKDIEIDLFDIFYSIGILGIIVYSYTWIQIIKKNRLQGIEKFVFILLIIISMFSGHILVNPMVSTYLAILWGLKEGSYK